MSLRPFESEVCCKKVPGASHRLLGMEEEILPVLGSRYKQSKRFRKGSIVSVPISTICWLIMSRLQISSMNWRTRASNFDSTGLTDALPFPLSFSLSACERQDGFNQALRYSSYSKSETARPVSRDHQQGMRARAERSQAPSMRSVPRFASVQGFEKRTFSFSSCSSSGPS